MFTMLIGDIEFVTIEGTETCIIHSVRDVRVCATMEQAEIIAEATDRDWVVPQVWFKGNRAIRMA